MERELRRPHLLVQMVERMNEELSALNKLLADHRADAAQIHWFISQYRTIEARRLAGDRQWEDEARKWLATCAAWRLP